ncbi:hypothetical protein EYF80_021858 [Liparis tanakae]|uniref:Uncharacterized protein n=1 Tax=Liparis tanakae TaxID=230148 RepID=A0A4Z2HPW8_9TELE|nr:hypothetical protein EYF80_021858 [Liparis tanakae]
MGMKTRVLRRKEPAPPLRSQVSDSERVRKSGDCKPHPKPPHHLHHPHPSQIHSMTHQAGTSAHKPVPLHYEAPRALQKVEFSRANQSPEWLSEQVSGGGALNGCDREGAARGSGTEGGSDPETATFT